jgi:hypothetical protein
MPFMISLLLVFTQFTLQSRFKNYILIRNGALFCSIVGIIFLPTYLLVIISLSVISTIMLFDKVQKTGLYIMIKSRRKSDFM